VTEPHQPEREDPGGERSLFVTDQDLRRLVAPHMGKESFGAAIKTLEAEGFPPVKPLFRGRFFPAVRAWLEQKYGVSANAVDSTAEDGTENFAPQRQHAGIEARSPRPPLLDREADRTGPDGLPGTVHPFAAGRGRGRA
jgi:hypothetical protein